MRRVVCLLIASASYSLGFQAYHSTVQQRLTSRLNSATFPLNNQVGFQSITDKGVPPFKTSSHGARDDRAKDDRELYTTMSNQAFSSYVKTLAAKRKVVPCPARREIIRHLFNVVYTLSNEEVFDCVWGVGTLGITVNDMSALQKQMLLTNVNTQTASAKQLLKCFSGLSKIGFQWSDIDATKQTNFLRAFIPVIADDEIVDTAQFDAREIATFVYTLGQLGFNKEQFGANDTTVLLNSVESLLPSCSTQGVANIFHGLAKMDFSWADVPQRLQSALFDMSTVLMPSMMIGIELSSILNSMALMKAKFSEFPEAFRDLVTSSLFRTVESYNPREISNTYWCLGKLNVDYSSLSNEVRQEFERVLVREGGKLQAFDTESLLVGLGLMKIDINAVSDDLRCMVLTTVEQHLDAFNIYGLHNAIWGLARMNVRLKDLSPTLAKAMFSRTILMLHTFQSTQYGDLMWSLGSIGYQASDMSREERDRLLAVVSRIFGKLHVRAAAYVLWGFGKMGFTWTDLKQRTCSLAGGREAPPLEDSAFAFLRKRINSMREHEFAVLLYALGSLDVDWAQVPTYVTNKIEHRVSRVATFLTPRSTSNALYGLHKSKVEWYLLSQEARTSWEDVLNTERGVQSMSAMELSQTIFSLGGLGVKWHVLAPSLRSQILFAFEKSFSDMSFHGLSSSIWGLAKMGCSWSNLSTSLIQNVFIQSETVESSVDRGHCLGFVQIMQALELFDVTLSDAEATILQKSTYIVMDELEPDHLVDLISSLSNLKLLKISGSSDYSSRLIVKLKGVIGMISTAKLANLNGILQKLARPP